MTDKSGHSVIDRSELGSLTVYQPLSRGGWSASYEMSIRSGEPVIRKIEIVRHLGVDDDLHRLDELDEDRARRLSASHLRSLKPGMAIAAARQRLRDKAEGRTSSRAAARGSQYLSRDLRPVKPGKRQTRTDEEFAQIAAIYLDALANGRTVTDAAASIGYQRSQMCELVRQARERELLAPRNIGRGRSGGYLTERAKELLAAD